MMDEALAALRELGESAALEARGQAARQSVGDDTQALRDFAEARKERQGFLPPGLRQRSAPGT